MLNLLVVRYQKHGCTPPSRGVCSSREVCSGTASSHRAGDLLIYMAVVNYLTDADEGYAASPLASYQLFENLGYGWAGSLMGFISVALSLVPVVLVWKGPEIRGRCPFMSESTFAAYEEVPKDETGRSGCKM
ncbi:hypothetical protein EYZ11_001972 [Aspergillus tanneri]|uniref:Uncharacterized protein n=1 Tax=Aspergillus tanneri TaxID=1220188 RepID=A0A4S3JS16_9EURO|nr:uncharacterized protein ATNIH1004_004189 [Aspergillus tanneri]KAA8648304.1 hypothetical protein ATNIH1004_004189 [Aspergillus tanneri]THC98542.1 hypothetical protein EYZ11_001972 [Aspergillus tanneri]